jgi:hypothetical protein
MTDGSSSRRKMLALLGALGTAGAASVLGRSGWEAEPVPPSEEVTRTDSEAGYTTTLTPTGDVVRLQEFDVAMDGRTDDTAAIQRALDAAAPAGTLLLPPESIRISGRGRDGRAINVTETHRNVTIRGTREGGAVTTLQMAPGHDRVHAGLTIGRVGGRPVDGVTVENLRLLGNGLEQTYRVGLGIHVVGRQAQRVELSNIRVENWATNGLKTTTPGTRVRDSTFHHNGHKAEAAAGYHGHGIDADIDGGGVVVERVLCTDNTGNGIDSNGGSVTLRDSVIRDNNYGVKLDEDTTGFRVSNTRFANHETTVFHNIPEDVDNGDLVLNKVRIEDAGWPAFHLPAGGTFEGDDIVIVRTNTDRDQPAAVVVKDEGRRFDVGTMSIHDTAGGSALYLQNCSGSIDRLVHGNNPNGVGQTGGVSIGSTERGDPLAISVPTAQDVGAGRDSSGDGSSGGSSGDSTDESPTYGGYSTPEQGSLDWHEPLNENFDSIEADILDLARRIEQLEN